MKIGSIVIRCYEFDKMLAFWQEALHYIPREPAKNGWVVLRDPKGIGTNLSLDKYAERGSGKRSRLHLDLYTTDREAEVERLVKLGARRYPWRYAVSFRQNGYCWRTLKSIVSIRQSWLTLCDITWRAYGAPETIVVSVHRKLTVECTSIVNLARELVAMNGAEERVQIIHGEMEAVELPEPVDIIVSEWMGGSGVDEGFLPAVLLARDRWLKPKGKMLPERVTAWIAPVWDSEIEKELTLY